MAPIGVFPATVAMATSSLYVQALASADPTLRAHMRDCWLMADHLEKKPIVHKLVENGWVGSYLKHHFEPRSGKTGLNASALFFVPEPMHIQLAQFSHFCHYSTLMWIILLVFDILLQIKISNKIRKINIKSLI